MTKKGTVYSGVHHAPVRVSIPRSIIILLFAATAVFAQEFAVDKKARIAAILKAILPLVPRKTSAPSDMGVSEWLNSSASSTPVVTKTIKA